MGNRRGKLDLQTQWPSANLMPDFVAMFHGFDGSRTFLEDDLSFAVTMIAIDEGQSSKLSEVRENLEEERVGVSTTHLLHKQLVRV